MVYLHDKIQKLGHKSKEKLKLFECSAISPNNLGSTTVIIVAKNKKIAHKIMKEHYGYYGKSKIIIKKELWKNWNIPYFEGVY